MDARVLLPRRLNGKIESTCPRQCSPLEHRTGEDKRTRENTREEKSETELRRANSRRDETRQETSRSWRVAPFPVKVRANDLFNSVVFNVFRRKISSFVSFVKQHSIRFFFFLYLLLLTRCSSRRAFTAVLL